MKILITGGHITPALAVIEEIKSREDHEILFVGRKYAIESEGVLSLEFKELEKRNIPFITLSAGRFTRLASFVSIYNLIKVPVGFIRAFSIVRRERPTALLSFGGYLALPIACACFIFRIPVFTHEQTTKPGLANKLIAIFAKKIFVSFEEVKDFFPAKKTILTGNPIRKAIFSTKKAPFNIPEASAVIYITGGSLGSHSINMHVKTLLPELLKSYYVIHQTGETKKYADYEALLEIKKNLPEELSTKYILEKHFLEDKIGTVYAAADIVVGRAGANTFFELIALEKPAIFIPLPWSANREQQRQAQIFRDYGVGEVFNQSEKSEKLRELIQKVSKSKDEYKESFKKLKFLYKTNAAELITAEILSH